MLAASNAAAAQNTINNEALVAAESTRLEEARKAASAKIDEIQDLMRSCMQALDRIKAANQPAPEAPAAPAPTADDVADEISQNLEAMMGTTEETKPKAEPRHPTHDSTTSKFANLQFGRNYDPNHG